MADEILILDAAGSNPDGSNPGSPLSIGPGTSYPLVEASFPAPQLNVLYSSSIDTEGENPVSRRYGNRTISLRIAMDETSAVNTLLDALAVKFAKLQREGGTLKRTRKDGSVRIYDIVAGDGWDHPYDLTYLLAHSTEVAIQLPAKPLARGASVLQADRTETTLPCLITTETGITGDVDAAGVWPIDNDASAGNDWWGLLWGVENDSQYTHTTSSGSGALYYEAESRTALGGSAAAVGPSGASGGGSNVMRNTSLSGSYVAVLSTQASGGGAHLSHVGAFRVYARVQVPATNTGTVSVALEWGTGDFRRFTQNATRTLDPGWEGTWRRVDLGLVTIPKVSVGTQRWEGRILAKSTVLNDDVDIDWIMLQPIDAGSGIAEAVQRVPSPTTFVALDGFAQTAGALNAKVAPTGGTWATSGGATDFQVSGSGTVTRNVGSEAEWAGRFAILGATNYTDVAAHIEVSGLNASAGPGGEQGWHGLILRYVDASNWLAVVHNAAYGGGNPAAWMLAFVKNVAGTKTTIAHLPVAGLGVIASPIGDYDIAVDATVSGLGSLTATIIRNEPSFGITESFILTGQDVTLATGGTLATGKPGFYSDKRVTARTFTFDNFRASSPPPDAAAFAGQSIQIRYDSVIREDSTGGFWQPPSSYRGDYLRVPQAGAEARNTRFIASPLYGPETNGVRVDHRTDDISGRLTYTPRYLT